MVFFWRCFPALLRVVQEFSRLLSKSASKKVDEKYQITEETTPRIYFPRNFEHWKRNINLLDLSSFLTKYEKGGNFNRFHIGKQREKNGQESCKRLIVLIDTVHPDEICF